MYLFCKRKPEDFNLNYIYICVVIGLLTWLITCLISHWFDQENIAKLDSVNNNIESNKNLLLSVLQNKLLLFPTCSRDETKYRSCFKKLFKNAFEVKISGIALTDFIVNLSLNKSDHPLIKALQSEKEVDFQFIMSHPLSEYVKFRDIIEENTCSKNIKENIDTLKKMKGKYLLSNFYKKNNSKFKIKVTCAPLDSAITYIKRVNNNASS